MILVIDLGDIYDTQRKKANSKPLSQNVISRTWMEEVTSISEAELEELTTKMKQPAKYPEKLFMSTPTKANFWDKLSELFTTQYGGIALVVVAILAVLGLIMLGARISNGEAWGSYLGFTVGIVGVAFVGLFAYFRKS